MTSPAWAFAQDLSGLGAAAAIENALVAAIAKAEKSVVAIARAPRGFEAGKLTDPSFVPNEYAAGVVVGDGLILTCAHVLGDVKKKNAYAVWHDRRPHVAKVLATDPWTDLAVLKIGAQGLTPIDFGDGDQLKKGRVVVALGNPYAIARDGKVSASWGIVSNLERKARQHSGDLKPAPAKETLHHFGTLIQMDVKLHKGTSGGALVDLRGQMVGLITRRAVAPGQEARTGFAIAVDDTFRRVVKTLKEGKEVEHGFLGVQPGIHEEDLLATQRGRGRHGARLVGVVPGTPAAEAGLVLDDIVTHVDGRPVYDADSLIRRISSLPVEAEVPLTIRRGRSILRRTAKLSKKPPRPGNEPHVTSPRPAWRGLQVDYATAASYNIRWTREVDPRGCVAVTDVERDSPAWEAGLRPGMFVTHVAGRRVSTPAEFLRRAESAGETAGRKRPVTLSTTNPGVIRAEVGT